MEAVPAQAPVVSPQALPVQALPAQALPAQGPLVPAQAVPVDWLQAIQCYDLNEPFHVRIGAVAGSYYPRKIPAAMADNKVLSLKVKTATGEVRVMHSVPETLVAVGYYKGDDALREAIRNSKRFMEHANEIVGKPASYLGINMLVELESRQELKIIDARLKVFQNFYMYTRFEFSHTNVLFCTHVVSQPREYKLSN